MKQLVLGLICALIACGSEESKPAPGGAGGTNEPSAGVGGSSSGGAAGTGGSGGASILGGSGGAGGEGGDEPDGPPPELDLTGLIETSGRHLVLRSSVPETPFAAELIALDLESGETHALSSGTAELTYVEVSPDLQTLLFSGANAASSSNLFMLRSVATGVMPMTPVTGFTDRPANYYIMGWSGDGRFAIYSRGSNLIDRGIDVVDVVANKLHGSIDADPEHSYAVARVAPAGPWLSFSFGNDEGARRAGMAHITDSGVELVDTDDTVTGIHAFSDDGTRVVYAAGPTSEAAQDFYRDLPSGAPVVIAPEPFDGLPYAGASSFSVDNDHVSVWFGDDTRFVARRLDLRTHETTALYEDGHDNAILYPFDAQNMIVYEDGTDYSIAVGDPTGARPFEAIATFAMGNRDTAYFGSLGERHAYYLTESVGLTLLARDDAGELQRATVAEPAAGFLCDLAQWRFPKDRGAFYSNDGTRVTLVDYSQPLARTGLALEPQHDGQLSCPVWHPSGEALAIAESMGDGASVAHSWIYVVRWPKGGNPTAPELVYEADTSLEVLFARP